MVCILKKRKFSLSRVSTFSLRYSFYFHSIDFFGVGVDNAPSAKNLKIVNANAF